MIVHYIANSKNILINLLNKKKCIDDCKKHNIYQYEYQNKCYATAQLGLKKQLIMNFYTSNKGKNKRR